MRSVDDSSGRRAKEIVVSLLGVPGRAHGKGPNCARRHTVVMLRVRLNILSEFVVPAVSVEINCLSSDDGVWTKSFGYTVGVRECVQPIYGMLGHFDDDSRWQVEYCRSRAFFLLACK